jgi:hypothetical protein
MPSINQTIYDILDKKFTPSSNQSLEWKIFLPIIDKLVQQGLNQHHAPNPFETQEALDVFKQALRHNDMRAYFHPSLLKHLEQLSIKGSPGLDELYSLCARRLLYAVYHSTTAHSAENLVTELEKRLRTVSKSSDIVLIDALTTMDASHLFDYYYWDARCGSLQYEKAHTIFEKYIRYANDEENLDIVRKTLEKRLQDIDDLDRQSLLLRIKDRTNYLQSQIAGKSLYQFIRNTKSEFELNKMSALLQQSCDEKNPQNPYKGLHFTIRLSLLEETQARIEKGFPDDVDYYGQQITDEVDTVKDTEEETLIESTRNLEVTDPLFLLLNDDESLHASETFDFAISPLSSIESVEDLTSGETTENDSYQETMSLSDDSSHETMPQLEDRPTKSPSAVVKKDSPELAKKFTDMKANMGSIHADDNLQLSTSFKK